MATRHGMLRSLKDFEGYKISAKDGAIGKIHDWFFDDEFWIVRYFVVDTGGWLPGRKVLLTPGVLLDADSENRSFSVGLDRKQVEESPDIDTDKPVSRQREIELHSHYEWPFYWSPGETWPMPITQMQPPPSPSAYAGDPHLRNIRDVVGYRIEASDGEIGFVDDFIADDETWAIRYLVISTHKWIPGRKVLISPQWLVGPISWSTQTVKVFMTKESIRHSPEFDPHAPVNRGYETELFDYYGRPAYWTSSVHQRRSKTPSSRHNHPGQARRTNKRKTAAHTVHFELTNPIAHKVCLAGTFNDWHPEKTELVPLGDGKWEKDISLESGIYEYRLVVDGEWMPDPNSDHTVLNPYGERNSVLTVP